MALLSTESMSAVILESRSAVSVVVSASTEVSVSTFSVLTFSVSTGSLVGASVSMRSFADSVATDSASGDFSSTEGAVFVDPLEVKPVDASGSAEAFTRANIACALLASASISFVGCFESLIFQCFAFYASTAVVEANPRRTRVYGDDEHSAAFFVRWT